MSYLTTDCQIGSRFPDIFDGIVEAVMRQTVLYLAKVRTTVGEAENSWAKLERTMLGWCFAR